MNTTNLYISICDLAVYKKITNGSRRYSRIDVISFHASFHFMNNILEMEFDLEVANESN